MHVSLVEHEIVEGAEHGLVLHEVQQNLLLGPIAKSLERPLSSDYLVDVALLRVVLEQSTCRCDLSCSRRERQERASCLWSLAGC